MPSGRKGDAPPFGAWRPTARSRFSAAALVDTHIWVWYLDGVADAMSAAALALLRRSVRTTGLLVSDMSIWELGTKSAKGKLTLAPSVADWLARAEAQSGFAFLPLTRPTLLAGTQLPGPIHGDPVDRLLVAQAASAAIPLVTADRLIIEYADHTRTLSVCDARR